MPNNKDFKNIEHVKETQLELEGWVSPISIQYGTGFEGGVPSYFWRVKGTSHTFVIPIIRMDFLSKGDYAKHFKETLQVFRNDYREWASEGFEIQWQQEYRDQFRKIISI